MKWGEQALIWPNREASRFVTCRPHHWHVQEMGPQDRPALLLLHGTGGTTHSWRDLLPALAQHHRVIALDLPGQGFTRMGTKQRSSLTAMAEDLARLIAQEAWSPVGLIGHSAGAALALRLVQLLRPPPRAVIGLNAALEAFAGPAEWAFPAMARMLALNPMVPAMFAASMGTTASVQSLLNSIGSPLDREGVALYRAAISDPDHVDGALTMMAQWDLESLAGLLPRIATPVLLLTGANDRAVDPKTSERAAAQLPNAETLCLPQLGHLLHEEAPAEIAEIIAAFVTAQFAEEMA